MPTRRDFLAGAASSGLLAALPLPDRRSRVLHGAERGAGATLAVDDTDLTWVARLRGKSRAVFDSPQVSEGGALFRAVLWRKQINSAFGTPVEDVTPVVVFRHEAIPLVMNDDFWHRMDTGKHIKLRDQNGKKWAKVNPLSGASPDVPAGMKEFTIPAFLNSGGVVLACGLAFGEIVAQYMKEDKLSKDDATARAKEHLIPGVIIQPSGFFAVLKAQEEGCNYMLGS
jgi:hypothetical protein